MENLRWILILAGFAILALLYFSGRAPRAGNQRDVLNASKNRKPAVTQDPLMGDSFESESMGDFPNTGDLPNFGDVDPEDFVRPAGGFQISAGEDMPFTDPDLEAQLASPPKTGIAGKIDAFSKRLSPKRQQRVAQSETSQADQQAAYASKIVTLHVVAQQDQVFPGAALYDQFEQRGYHYGEMNIFHSMHQGKTVFSIAKIVEPGYFDIDNIDSFQTPGISLILQLPGPVAADVAFEVLISEAWDLAQGLGGIVLDADHSTLSNQAVQHLREGIYEYMHRQKYFSGVPS